MMIDFIRWNVNPEIFHIGPLHVRWYGLLFAASFYFGYLLFMRFFKLENIKIEVLDRLTMYMAFGTVIGARLGHCFFYGPLYDVYDANNQLIEEGYLSHPLNILKVYEGGLASHGAAIGILLALAFFTFKEKRSYLWIVDRIVITVALSGFFIRMGNLMNSEIYGIPTKLPWGFIFVRDMSEWNLKHPGVPMPPMHPTQIYEALSYLAIFGILLWLYFRDNGKPKEGLLFSLFLIFVFSARFFIESIKNVQVEKEIGMTLNIGQKLSIPFVLAGIILLIIIFRGKILKTKTESPQEQ